MLLSKNAVLEIDHIVRSRAKKRGADNAATAYLVNLFKEMDPNGALSILLSTKKEKSKLLTRRITADYIWLRVIQASVSKVTDGGGIDRLKCVFAYISDTDPDCEVQSTMRSCVEYLDIHKKTIELLSR